MLQIRLNLSINYSAEPRPRAFSPRASAIKSRNYWLLCPTRTKHAPGAAGLAAYVQRVTCCLGSIHWTPFFIVEPLSASSVALGAGADDGPAVGPRYAMGVIERHPAQIAAVINAGSAASKCPASASGEPSALPTQKAFVARRSCLGCLWCVAVNVFDHIKTMLRGSAG